MSFATRFGAQTIFKGGVVEEEDELLCENLLTRFSPVVFGCLLHDMPSLFDGSIIPGSFLAG